MRVIFIKIPPVFFLQSTVFQLPVKAIAGKPVE
jgi:hypothetical protein